MNASLNSTANKTRSLYNPFPSPIRKVFQCQSNIDPNNETNTSEPVDKPNPSNLKCIVKFVATNCSVFNSHGFNHQNAPKEYIYKLVAHMFLTQGEPSFDIIANCQSHITMA